MTLSTNNTHTFQSGELVTADKLNNTKVVQTGTTSDHSGFTGSQGQLTFNTTTNKLVVHDGSTEGGNPLQNSADSVSIGDDSITTSELGNGAVTETKIADGAVTTAKIDGVAVTTDKIPDDQITSAKLADSGVVAGEYTSVNIEVNSQGLVTSASNGEGASSGLVYTQHIPTTSDGIHTAQNNQALNEPQAGLQSSGSSVELRAAIDTIKTRSELQAPADAKFVHLQVTMDSSQARFDSPNSSPFHVQEYITWAHAPATAQTGDHYDGRVGILSNHTGTQNCFVPFINSGSGEDYIQFIANPASRSLRPDNFIDGDNINIVKLIGYLS